MILHVIIHYIGTHRQVLKFKIVQFRRLLNRAKIKQN